MITGPSTEAKRDPTYQKQYDSIQAANSTSKKDNTSSSSGSSGSSYTIGSAAGQNIAQNLIKNPGSSTTVSDGSTWTSDASGNVWVTKDGVTTKATITGTSSSGASSAGSGSSSSSGISLAAQDEKKTLVEQATSGDKKYGLSFQSSANQKIDSAYEAYSKRKQELVDRATSNDVKVNVKEDKAQQAAQREQAKRAEENRQKRIDQATSNDIKANVKEDKAVQRIDREIASIDQRLEKVQQEIIDHAAETGGKGNVALEKERYELKKQKKALEKQQNEIKGDYGVAGSLWRSLNAGAGSVNSAVTSTLSAGAKLAMRLEALVNGGEAPLTGSLFQPIFDLDAWTKQQTANAQAGAAQGWSHYGTAGNLANEITQGVMSAVPNAALTAMTAGGSAAATIAPQATGMAATVTNAVKTLAKNPMYWTSFIQSFGGSYDEALEKGATEDQALIASLLSSTANAIVEIGGGVEELPGELRKEGLTSAGKIRKWVESSLDEGKEEVVQGMIERLVNKAIYNKDARWVSTTDEDAVINPMQSAKEGAMGAAVGGILGGGQMLAQGVIDAANRNRLVDPTASAWDQAMLDTLRGIQTPENVTQTRQATAMDNAILQTLNQNKNTPANVSQNATSTGTQLNIDNTRNNAYNYSTGGVTNGYTDQLDRTSGTGVWGRPDGYQTGAGTQRGTSYDGRGNLPVSGIVLLSPKSRQTLTQRGIVNVELHDSSTDSAAFSHALDAARAADQRNGWAVTPKSADELTQAGTKSYMDSKGSTGFAIAQDGDIEAVFANKAAGAPKGSTKSTIPQAIALGGNKLDCYGAGLVSLYSKYGFVPVARVGFNAEYANDGWTADKGSPDIYFMMHNGDSADTVVQNMGNYKIWSEADLAALPVMEYDEAYAYRDSLLKQRTPDALQNAREQYGTIPAGENPVREVSLPQSVDGERKVSRFARTAAEAQVTTDEMVERIEQMVADGKLDHSVYSNKQALSDGAKQIEHEYARGKSIEQIRSEFIRDANSGKAGAKFISQGTTLYADAIAEGNYQAAADILVALIAVETNAGRTVQAARLMKSMTPEGRIFTVQKMVSNLEGQINQRRSANNQLELNVPDALLEAYQSATTQDAQQAALDSIYDYIAAEIPTTLREGLRQWRYFSMLANPSTHLKNIKGNISGAIAKIGKDNLAALGETLIIGDKEGRTKAFLNPMSKADQNLLNLSWADYDNAADLFEDSTGKYSQAAGEINDRRRYWKINDPQNSLTRGMDKALGVLEKASDLNSKALEVEDMWFSKPMYSVALAGYMKANHLTEITDAARTYAMTEAKRGTFNDINKVSKWATNLGQNSKIGRFLAGIVYPFKKVPANVMVRTVEYSPLGYLKGLYDLAKMKGNPDITVAQTIDDFAAATTGTALLGIGALLAKHGILRATGVGDDKEKEQQKNAFGAKDFSLLAGDNYIPIGSLTIIGTGLLVGAQIWESAQNMKNGDAPIALEDVLDALSKITDPVFEQSMLSGLDSILSTLQNSADAGTGETATKIGIQILGNYIGQYVPSFVGRVASSLDKNQRSTYTEPNGVWAPIQGAVQGVQQKIPGLREQMAVRYGNWGVPVDGNGANGVGRAIFNALTPVYPSKQKTDPVEEEIARLHDVNAEYSNFYKKPSKSIAVGREMVKLTSDQYAQYIETSGQTDYGIRAEMLESEIYKRVSDDVKSKAMSLSQEYANAIGKEAAGVGYESDEKWVNELKGKSEEEIAEAILAKAISDKGYLSDDLQQQLDTVKSLYGSGAYAGTAPELLEAAKEKAEAYYQNVEKSKYGYELTDDEQALEGENQKVIAEHFLEKAVADKYKDKNKDGTKMDEVLDAYKDGEISEKLAMSMLEDQVVDAYADFGKEAGVTAEMVLQTANAYARMKTEKDIDDVVTLSVEAQLDDWLDEQNWTDKQKEALRLGYYASRVESYNKLVEKLENGSITVGEAKKSLTSKYQAAWTHEVSKTGTEMQDYISALAAYENAPSEAERDAMGFDSKWAWYCNELNKTDLTAEQKFAIVNATNDYAEKTQKKIAQALKATYVPTDSGGAGNSGSSYGSGGSSGGASSGWSRKSDEPSQIEKAYERFGKNVGVTESMMQQAKDAKEKMYAIVDMDGKTVHSVEDQFDAWLAKQSWTAEQKEAVRSGFYTDTVKNLQWLSANLRSGNISTAEAKFELSPTLQAGWSTNVLESGASMADYIDAVAVFKQAPKEDDRKALGYKTKWEWWCDKLNETSMTPEQKYAVAISVQEYGESTKKKIAKKLSWTGKKEDATAKTSSIASTGDAFWDELARRLGHSLTQGTATEATTATTVAAPSTAAQADNEFWEELERRLGRPLEQQSESAQEATYQIRTDTGYREYLNLLAGRSNEYKASDGSVWTKGEDGEVYATKNGKSMRAEAVFDKADSSAQTRSSAAENAQEDGYTVNSAAGKLAYQMLENGVLTEWPATDGWTWKRTDSGIIAVKGKMRLPVLLAG